VFQGYYKQPKETEESFHVDPQGRRWFMTGDVGTWLPDGSLKMSDKTHTSSTRTQRLAIILKASTERSHCLFSSPVWLSCLVVSASIARRT